MRAATRVLQSGIKSTRHIEPITRRSKGLSISENLAVGLPHRSNLEFEEIFKSESYLLIPTLAAVVTEGCNSKISASFLVRLLIEEHITSVHDVREVLQKTSSDSLRLDPVVSAPLSARLIEVVSRAHAVSLLPPTTAHFFRSTHPTQVPEDLFSHIIRTVSRISPTYLPQRTKTLQHLVLTAKRYRIPISDGTYVRLIDASAHDPALRSLILSHMKVVRYGKGPLQDLILALNDSPLSSPRVRLERLAKRKSPNSSWYHTVLFRYIPKLSHLRRYMRLVSGRSSWRLGANELQVADEAWWTEFVRRRVLDGSSQTKRLLTMLKQMEGSPQSYPLNPRLYTSFIQGLVDRDELELAWSVWEKLWNRCWRNSRSIAKDQKWTLGPEAITLGIHLHSRLHDNLSEAFKLMHNAKLADLETGFTKPAITAGVVNQLLQELAGANRTDAIFYVWQDMSREYGIARTDQTLITVLETATRGSIGSEESLDSRSRVERLATSMADNLHRMLAAARRRKQLAVTEDIDQLCFDRRMAIILSRPPPRREDVYWDGLIAWQRARLIFLEVLLGNWPGLGRVKNPLEGGWEQPLPDSLLRHPNRQPQAPPFHIEFGRSTHLHDTPPPPNASLYPEIMPSDRTFRAYIRLLGEHELTQQIPLALAWMRALEIDPTKDTLVAALAYYRESSDTSRPPLIEAYGAGRQHKDFQTLTTWVSIWQPHRMPKEEELKRFVTSRRLQRDALKWRDSDERGVVEHSWD